MNRCILVGTLEADPFTASTITGKKITTFELMVDTPAEYEKEIVRTDRHKIVTWSKTAQACEKMLRAGSKVYIEGQIRSYPNESGSNTCEIFANEVIFFSKL